MNAIPDAELEGHDRDKRLERVLYSLKGQSVPAVNLMEAIGMDFTIKEDGAGKWVIIPHTAFIEFYWLMRRAQVFFHGHGYRLNYLGSSMGNAWIMPGFSEGRGAQ